jgi:hypothetical protein
MKKSTLIFAVTNLVGMIFIFLFCVSTANFAKMEERDYYDFGDSLSIILIALPVLLVCFVVNACWGIKALIGFFRRRDYRGCVPFAVVMAAWALIYLICMLVTKLPPNPAGTVAAPIASLFKFGCKWRRATDQHRWAVPLV